MITSKGLFQLQMSNREITVCCQMQPNRVPFKSDSSSFPPTYSNGSLMSLSMFVGSVMRGKQGKIYLTLKYA